MEKQDASTLAHPYFDDPFKNYWYDEQLVAYIKQVMAVFSGMYVKIGKNANNDSRLVEVPVRYSGVDRVVESIIAGNTTNKPLRLPIFSVKLADLQPAPERYKGVGTSDRMTYLPRGESLPDGVKVMYRRTALPYKLAFELNIFTSNDLQKFQILEQILTVFNPSIQIQTSDEPFDGGKITVLTLENIAFEENYPSNNDKKTNITSMVFSTYAWLQVPINFRDNFVKSIHIRLNALTANKDFDAALDSDIQDSISTLRSKIDVDDFQYLNTQVEGTTNNPIPSKSDCDGPDCDS
jgi:hypothetical protein